MIKPLNRHLVVEPLEHDGFMMSQRTTYEEVGTVIEMDGKVTQGGEPLDLIGKKVYFDSWLAKKYPVPGQNDKFYWLVKFDDVVAYEE